MAILYFLFVIGLIIIPILESQKLKDFDKSLEKLEIGMSLDEVKELLGTPNSVSEMLNTYLIQWNYTSSSGGYHIAMSFDYNFKLIKIDSVIKT